MHDRHRCGRLTGSACLFSLRQILGLIIVSSSAAISSLVYLIDLSRSDTTDTNRNGIHHRGRYRVTQEAFIKSSHGTRDPGIVFLFDSSMTDSKLPKFRISPEQNLGENLSTGSRSKFAELMFLFVSESISRESFLSSPI